MTSVLSWLHPGGGIEIRLGSQPPITRLAVGDAPRIGSGPLFLDADPPRLPAAVLPLVDMEGRIVDPRVLTEGANSTKFREARLVLPSSHPQVLAEQHEGQGRVLPALWIESATEADFEALRARGRLLHGIFLRENETVSLTGSDVVAPTRALFVRRLPRIIFEDHHLIADNTDGALSMGWLLEEFVRRFSEGEGVLPNVRVATGYLYHHGLQRVLGLLNNDGVKSLHVLFSGKTDALTARAITSQLTQQIVPGVEDDASGAMWEMYRAALASGRLQFRVYTDAFLHAKLFLGWQSVNKFGKLNDSYGVVGSSNLSVGGLAHAGNLELDVTLQEPDTNTRLLHWFEARWDEASLPSPSLLEVLEAHRPQPPPSFNISGLFDVWNAGTRGQLVSPDQHLALLGKLYEDRLTRVRLPDEIAYPPVSGRLLDPSKEQEEGVLALAQRLLSARVAFLADSVGLGKTATAVGTVWYLKRHGRALKAAVVAPRKLFGQWQSDTAGIGAPPDLFRLVNRHTLERCTDAQAVLSLAGTDVLVVEEAHEVLRTRSNKLWRHLRAHLAANPECLLLLVSATPWNNSREDIFNYLLLAWNEGRALRERYPALEAQPLASQLGMFMLGVAGGSLSAAQAVRKFDNLPSETWRRIFDQAFVQRTRSSLVRRYGAARDFPERRVHSHATPPSPSHDALFASLAHALGELRIPYQEPFRTLLAAASATGQEGASEVEPSNLRRSFLTQLFKRAESSEFALAVSLAGIERRLVEFDEAMQHVAAAKSPKEALAEWVTARFAGSDEVDDQEQLFDDVDAALDVPDEDLAAAEHARSTELRGLVERLDNAQALALVRQVSKEQVGPDLERIRALRARLTLEMDERSPKALLLSGLARDALPYKPVLVAAYADTAVRAFVRLTALFPDKRIGLAIGGDEAFLYRPTVDRAKDLTPEEWDRALLLLPDDRRHQLLVAAGRARAMDRGALLAAFAPRARHATPELLLSAGGAVDILVGSEAISVGHNLQDSTCLIQLDLPWNPMVIEQRIGRIDRRGGGRIDPPTGTRIVDVHYCWSHAAIEEEVGLRERLKAKAGQAIADTRFDELLLHELYDEVQRVRRERAIDADDSVGVFLGQKQQELAEARTRVTGVRPGSGSNLDGLRQLAKWRAAHENVSAPEPVVAAAAMSGPLTDEARWLLTVALTPTMQSGMAIPDGERLLQIPVESAAAPESLLPDIEAVVSSLVHAGEPTSHPGLARAKWADEVRHLDALLGDFRALALSSHNAEVDNRILAALAPAAAREPGARLRALQSETRNVLAKELKRLHETHLEMFTAQKERLAFLMQRVLDPKHVIDLVAHEDEEELLKHLAAAKALPHAFFTEGFEAKFEELCGRAYAEFREPGKALAKQAAQIDFGGEGRWGGLDIRVLAATFTAA